MEWGKPVKAQCGQNLGRCTCCSLVTTLCRLQYGVAAVCAVAKNGLFARIIFFASNTAPFCILRCADGIASLVASRKPNLTFYDVIKPI